MTSGKRCKNCAFTLYINHFNPSSRTPPTAKGGNNPPFAVGGGRTRLPHSPTAKGGPTLHGGWAYLHGGQSPISPQLKTNVLPPPAVFSCGNRNGGDEQDPGTSDRDDHKSVFNCFSHSFRIHFIKLRPCQHQCTKPVFLQSFLVD